MEDRAEVFHKILFVIAGVCRLYLPGPARLPAGSYKAVAAGMVHRLEDSDPATVLVLCMSREYVDALPERAKIWRGLVSKAGASRPQGIDAAGIYETLRRLLFEQNHRRHASDRLRTIATVDTLLSRLAKTGRNEAAEVSSRGRVQQVVERLTQRPYEPHDVARAAADCGLSQRRFRELFRDVSGKTFGEFLSSVRSAYAAKLMTEQLYSVTASAFSSGFRDLSSFYRAFRKEYGEPPGVYRRRSSTE